MAQKTSLKETRVRGSEDIAGVLVGGDRGDGTAREQTSGTLGHQRDESGAGSERWAGSAVYFPRRAVEKLGLRRPLPDCRQAESTDRVCLPRFDRRCSLTAPSQFGLGVMAVGVPCAQGMLRGAPSAQEEEPVTSTLPIVPVTSVLRNRQSRQAGPGSERSRSNSGTTEGAGRRESDKATRSRFSQQCGVEPLPNRASRAARLP